MNYIKEINAFYNELELNPLSSSAISLWYALLHICNKSGWKNEFTVPVGTLSLKSGLSERSISNARNELKTKGYIDFKSRGGNRSAIYRMVSLSANIADNFSGNSSDNASGSVSDYPSDNASALFKHKQNETKQGSSRSAREESPFDFYQQNFGILKPFVSESIGMWCDDLSEEIVVAAMKLAVKRGGNTFSYVEPILKEWATNRLSTISDVRDYEEHKKAKKGVNYGSEYRGSPDQTPRKDSITGNQVGWLNKHKRKKA